MKPHKHAELIKAWADGAEIQWLNKVDGVWDDCLDTPTWSEDYEYRIKLEPGKQWMYIYNNTPEGKSWISPVTPDYYRGVAHIVYMGKIEVIK